MITRSYATLSDGTLVDFEHDGEVLTVRAGRSLDPQQRNIVFVLRAHDASEVGLHLAGFLALRDVTDELPGTLEAFISNGQRAQAAVDAILRDHSNQDDAQATYDLFARMSSEELVRLLDAHHLDMHATSAPASIMFSGGRMALIRAVLRTRHGAAFDEIHVETLADALQEEVADETRGPVELVLRPVVALQLAVLVQLAMRHPATADTTTYRTGRLVIEHLRRYFADAPSVLAVLREGEP